jgi:imidazoleglycerol-phosphate dehydratase
MIWESVMVAARRVELQRETKETRVSVRLDLDGRGEGTVATGIGFLDHMLQQLARHGRFDLAVTAEGDLAVDTHHTTEDVALTLGRAFGQALGARGGIVRMGHAVVPLDEALALVAVDISGRGYAAVDCAFASPRLGDLDADMLRHFLEAFASEARLTLHATMLRGTNDHHKAEALFKALARALHQASRLDPTLAGEVPSTKGVIEAG